MAYDCTCKPKEQTHCYPKLESGGKIVFVRSLPFRGSFKFWQGTQGFVFPDERAPESAEKLHRSPDVLTAYLADLRENRRPEKSVKSKRFELEEFAKFC